MLSQKNERKEKQRSGKKKFGPDERMAFAAGKEIPEKKNGFCSGKKGKERVTCHGGVESG